MKENHYQELITKRKLFIHNKLESEITIETTKNSIANLKRVLE